MYKTSNSGRLESSSTLQWHFQISQQDYIPPRIKLLNTNVCSHRSQWPAAQSKARVCGRSLAEILASNPTRGMDGCLLWVLCAVRWTSLRRAAHSSRGVLPTVVRRCVWSRSLVNEEAMAHWGAVVPKTINDCSQSQGLGGADLETEYSGKSQFVFILCSTFVRWFVPKEVLVRILPLALVTKSSPRIVLFLYNWPALAFLMLPDTGKPGLVVHKILAAPPSSSHVSFSVSLIDNNNNNNNNKFFHLKFQNEM